MKKIYTCIIAWAILMAPAYSQTLRHEFPTANGTVNALTKLGNTIYIGGSFTSVNSVSRNHLAAFDATTGTLLPWDPGADGPVTTLSATGNTVYIGGDFSNAGGQPRTKLAALDAVSGLPTSWSPVPNGSVFSIRASNEGIYIGGDFTTMFNTGGNPFALYLARLDPVTAARLPLAGTDSGVDALALNGNTLYVGGGFTGLGNTSRHNLGAVETTTGNPTSWDPGGTNSSVFEIAPKDNTVYVGGTFTAVGTTGLTRNHVAAFDANTAVALPWDPNTNGPVRAVAPAANGIYIGGTFGTVGGQTRNNLAFVEGTTGAPLPWSPNPDGTVADLLVDGTTLFVAGSFTTIAGESRGGLAAFSLLTTVPAYTLLPAKIEAEDWSAMSGVQTEPTGDTGGGLNVGYIDNGDWMDYTIYAPSTGTYNLTLRLATPSTSNPRLQIRLGDTVLNDIAVPNTGDFQVYQSVTVPIDLMQGAHTLRLLNTGYGYWNINWLQFDLPSAAGYTLIPAKIEAENWSAMSGVQTEPTSDEGGGLNVGYIDNGDWMEYNISVPAAGLYTLNLRLATPSTSYPHLDILLGSATLSSIDVPNTGGFQNWQTVPVTLNLPQGNYPLRILNTGYGYWNINWLQLEKQLTDYTVIPAKIEAENWNAMSGVQSENTSDEGGGLNVGNIDHGDWMEYNIYVPATGKYGLLVRFASPTSLSSVGVSLGDTLIDVIGTGTNTGSFQVYKNIALPMILTKGSHKLRLTNTGYDHWNVNWLSIDLPILPGYTLIPAKIQAERPNETGGTENESTTDIDGGQHLHIDNGDWVRYWITAPGSGLYKLNLRVASATSSLMQVERGFTSQDPLGVTIPNTGGLQNWQTITFYRYLDQGPNEVTFRNVSEGSWNFNWVEFLAPSEYPAVQKEGLSNNLALQTNTTLNVYPNPISQNFTLEWKNGIQGKARVDVLNMSGSVVKTFYVNKTAGISRNNLSLYGLAGGQYILQVQMNGFKETKKILKR